MIVPAYFILPDVNVASDMVLIIYRGPDEIVMYDTYGNAPVEINEARFYLMLQMAADRADKKMDS